MRFFIITVCVHAKFDTRRVRRTEKQRTHTVMNAIPPPGVRRARVLYGRFFTFFFFCSFLLRLHCYRHRYRGSRHDVGTPIALFGCFFSPNYCLHCNVKRTSVPRSAPRRKRTGFHSDGNFYASSSSYSLKRNPVLPESRK